MSLFELFNSPDAPDAGLGESDIARLEAIFSLSDVKSAQRICVQGQGDENEYLLFQGRARSCLIDAEGREVSLSFYLAPMVITPNIARTKQGISLVDIEILRPGKIGICNTRALLDLMVEYEGIREWGNGIMRKELQQKVAREWCLSALGAAGRLAWFRENYPDYEKYFTQSQVASHLGMTPVTLSRIRHGG